MVERAAEIRLWTRPAKGVGKARLVTYSHAAAAWVVYRLRCGRNPLPGDDRRFLELSATVRALVEDLGLVACTVDTARADGVPGITDRDGFLIGDPARILT